MSPWHTLKQLSTWSWREQWREIAAGTLGEQPPEAVELLEALTQAELAGNRRQFLALKAQLANLPSWTGSPATSTGAPGAVCEKPTEAPTQLGFLT